MHAQADILTIGVQMQRRGHQVTALVADSCAAEARHFLRSDKFLSLVPSDAPPPSSPPQTSSDLDHCNDSSSHSCGGDNEGLACAAEGSEVGSCTNSGSPGDEVEDSQEESADATQEGHRQETQMQEMYQQQQQQQQHQQQQQPGVDDREAQRDAVLVSINLMVYSGGLSLEEFISTKVGHERQGCGVV